MDNVTKKLQVVLDAQIGKGYIHNVVAAVQSHDRSLDFCGAAGVADPVSGTPMTPETSYFIASVNKMYTAAVLLRLYQEQRVELDAPLSKYLPETLTRGIHVYKGTDYSQQIKVVELLAQTSGLADYEADKPRGGKSIMEELKAGKDRGFTTEETLEVVRNLSPHFPPGTPGKAYYSNANYRLLGEVIESITGKSLEVNFEEMIFTPLGLKHTYLYDCGVSHLNELPATLFMKDQPAYVPKYLASSVADGGLISTLSESLTFLRAFFEGQLFDKALFDKMMCWNPIFFPLRYGYGLMYFKLPRFVSLRPLPEFIGHSGSTGSFAFTCPSRSMYLAGTLNQVASPAAPFFFMMQLLRALG